MLVITETADARKMMQLLWGVSGLIFGSIRCVAWADRWQACTRVMEERNNLLLPYIPVKLVLRRRRPAQVPYQS